MVTLRPMLEALKLWNLVSGPMNKPHIQVSIDINSVCEKHGCELKTTGAQFG
jgi:hypothetical protein